MDERDERNEQESPREPTPEEQPLPAGEPAQPAGELDTPVPPPEEPVPPRPTPAPYPVPPEPGAPPPPQNTNTLITWGWVLVALSFLTCCCGFVFAIPAIILGVIAYTRGDQRGLWIIIAGAVALLFGGGFGIFWGGSEGFRNRVPGFPLPGGRPV